MYLSKGLFPCHHNHRIDRFRKIVIAVRFYLFDRPDKMVIEKLIKEINSFDVLNLDNHSVLEVFGKQVVFNINKAGPFWGTDSFK